MASVPWLDIIKGGAKAADGQSGGSGGGGGKGNGLLGKIGARSNMPKEAIMGLGSGLIQSIQAKKLKNEAKSAMPGLIDPRQASMLSELNQKRKSIDTGAAFQTGMNAIGSTQAATNEAIGRNTGGNTAGTIQALLQAQRTAGDAQNSVLGQGQNQQLAYNSMYNQLNNQIAGRALQLQMYKSQQARAEWAQKQQVANQNVMAGVAGLMEQKQQYGKPNVEQNPAGNMNSAPMRTNSLLDWNKPSTVQGNDPGVTMADTSKNTPQPDDKLGVEGVTPKGNGGTQGASSNIMSLVKNGTSFMSK